MRAIGAILGTVAISLLGIVVACHTDSPVFTPAPGDYPCHRQDGSADPWAVSCRPYDGTPTCCPSNHRCAPDDFCEYTGSEAVNRGSVNNAWIGGSAPVKRIPERP